MKMVIVSRWNRDTRKTEYLVMKGLLLIAKRDSKYEAEKVKRSLERAFDPWMSSEKGANAWLTAPTRL